MPVMTVNGKAYPVPVGIRLSEALAQTPVSTAWPCGGLGRCGKCRVTAFGALSDPDGQEKAFLSEEERQAGVRLACRTFVLGDCRVEAAVSGGEAIQTDGGAGVSVVRPAFRRFGAAVDLGTTTLAARLYDTSGTCLASGGRMNPQRRWGADVISRIQASMDGAREEIAACVREGIAGLLRDLPEQAGIETEAMDGAVITGNTAMLYLLTASAPDALSRAPFEADRLFGCEVEAASLALPLAPVRGSTCRAAFRLLWARISRRLSRRQACAAPGKRGCWRISAQTVRWRCGTAGSCAAAPRRLAPLLRARAFRWVCRARTERSTICGWRTANCARM